MITLNKSFDDDDQEDIIFKGVVVLKKMYLKAQIF